MRNIQTLQRIGLIALGLRWIVLTIVALALVSKLIALFSPKFRPVLNAAFAALPIVTTRSVLWIGVTLDIAVLLITFLVRDRRTRVLCWLLFAYTSVSIHLYVHLFAPTGYCACIRLDAFGLNVSPIVPELIAFISGCLALIAVHLDSYVAACLSNTPEAVRRLLL